MAVRVAMAPKRKSGKRRSKENGLIKGILIGLAVVAGLGGVGFVGYQIYSKAILPAPALTEQKAQKLPEEVATPERKPLLPKGWKTYKAGTFQMLVPAINDLPDASSMSKVPGVIVSTLYFGRADSMAVNISKTSITGSHPELNGRNLFDVLDPAGIASQRNGKLIGQRQLEGVPRCLEASIELDQKPGILRFYEESPTDLLIVAIEGDSKSTMFRDVVSSISFQSPTPSITSPPVDILTLINTQQHRIAGDWSKRGRDVLSPVTEAAMLELPIQATPSYEMNFEVERSGTKIEPFYVAFPFEGTWGMFVLDDSKGVSSGLHLCNGQTADANPDSYEKQVFRPGKNHILLQVTPTTILVEVNHLTIVNWSGNPQSLSLEYSWRAGQGKAFIGTSNAEFIVSRIDFQIML